MAPVMHETHPLYCVLAADQFWLDESGTVFASTLFAWWHLSGRE